MRGWDVFDSTFGITIERDDEANLFRSDEDAIHYVIGRAAAGDEYAREALICVAAQNYIRWRRFLEKQNDKPDIPR